MSPMAEGIARRLERLEAGARRSERYGFGLGRAKAETGLDEIARELEAIQLCGIRREWDTPRDEIRERAAAHVRNDAAVYFQIGYATPTAEEVERTIDAETDRIAQASYEEWQAAQKRFGTGRSPAPAEGP